MKRISLICIGIIIFFSGMSYAVDTLTVTSPNGGERWKIGSTHDITWNDSGLTGSVMITLHRGGINTRPVISIANSIPASLNTYRWTIPAVRNNGQPLTPASDYKILVRRNTTPVDSSNSNFTILSQSSLPNVLQHRQIGTPKQRIQATRPAAQRAPARTTRQQARANRGNQLGLTTSPDLYVREMSSVINPKYHLNRVAGNFLIVNKGVIESSVCDVRIKFKSDDSAIDYEIRQSVPALAPGSQLERTFLFRPGTGTALINKHGGWYTTIVIIDPSKRSGENNMFRINNTKTIRHHIEELPFMVGCIDAFFFDSPPRLAITFKNIGGAVMPASYFSLKTNCPKNNFSKTYREYHPAIQPDEKKELYFILEELQPIISLCANTSNPPGASLQDAEVQFILDLDPEGLSSESRVSEQFSVRKSCDSLNFIIPSNWILLNRCSGNL